MSLVTIRYCQVCMFKQRAARVADLLRERLDVEVDIESGGFGEFSVMVGDRSVVRRTSIALPREQDILEAVRADLNGAHSPQPDGT